MSRDLILITRPFEDAHRDAAELKARGFSTFIEPMLTIERLDFTLPDLSAYQALVFTSAHAVELMGAVPELPVYAVGERTAEAARDMGFTTIITGGGDVTSLAALINQDAHNKAGRFLHIRGEHVVQSLQPLLDAELTVDDLVVYTARASDCFSDDMKKVLEEGRAGAVLFFSKRTAETFISIINDNRLQSTLKSIKALCISDAVLECVRPYEWAETYAASVPDREGMMALLDKIMNTGHKRMTNPMSDKPAEVEQGIENAEAVIERFGGIRPMAKKVEVAVTTVQGWKKRNVIPAARRDQVLEAARVHNVDLSDILKDGAASIPAANENLRGLLTEKPTEAFSSFLKTEEPAAETPPPAEAVSQPAQSFVSETTRPEKPFEMPTAVFIPPEKKAEFEMKLAQTERRAIKKSTWINAILLLIGLAAVVVLLIPSAEKNTVRIASLEGDVGKLKGDVDAVKAEQSFLSTIIPKDLDKRIADLQVQAQQAQQQVGQALEKAGEISNDVLGENAGTLDQRMDNLEAHMTELMASPEVQAVMARFQEMSASLAGQQQLDQAVAELSTVTTNAQIQGGTALDAMLADARAQSSTLGQTFEGVPAEDMKAAALLLAMSQFRQSLNRDATPFEDDLALLKNLVSKDNAELAASLDKLAPEAKEGVLTPAGLMTEFKTMAGDAVVESLKGEDVSVEEKAKAKINQIFNVEKNNEMITGTPEQIKMSKAEKLLQDGNIESAIAEVETLQGPAASVAQPWLAKARSTLNAQKMKMYLEQTMEEVSKGTSVLIQDQESGINILKRSTPLSKDIYQ